MSRAKSNTPASPWAALLHSTHGRHATSAAIDSEGRPATKLGTLLNVLAERHDATTITLSVCTDLCPRQVWGLLKDPRSCGQVRFDNGRWSLVSNFPGRDVLRAAELLRKNGWRVKPPLTKE